MITNSAKRFKWIINAFGLLLLFPLVAAAQPKLRPILASKKPAPLYQVAGELRERARWTLLADRIPLQVPESHHLDAYWPRSQSLAQAGNGNDVAPSILAIIELASRR